MIGLVPGLGAAAGTRSRWPVSRIAVLATAPATGGSGRMHGVCPGRPVRADLLASDDGSARESPWDPLLLCPPGQPLAQDRRSKRFTEPFASGFRSPAVLGEKPARLPVGHCEADSNPRAQTWAWQSGRRGCQQLTPGPPARPGQLIRGPGYPSRQVSDQPGVARYRSRNPIICGRIRAGERPRCLGPISHSWFLRFR